MRDFIGRGQAWAVKNLVLRRVWLVPLWPSRRPQGGTSLPVASETVPRKSERWASRYLFRTGGRTAVVPPVESRLRSNRLRLEPTQRLFQAGGQLVQIATLVVDVGAVVDRIFRRHRDGLGGFGNLHRGDGLLFGNLGDLR